MEEFELKALFNDTKEKLNSINIDAGCFDCDFEITEANVNLFPHDTPILNAKADWNLKVFLNIESISKRQQKILKIEKRSDYRCSGLEIHTISLNLSGSGEFAEEATELIPIIGAMTRKWVEKQTNFGFIHVKVLDTFSIEQPVVNGQTGEALLAKGLCVGITESIQHSSNAAFVCFDTNKVFESTIITNGNPNYIKEFKEKYKILNNFLKLDSNYEFFRETKYYKTEDDEKYFLILFVSDKKVYNFRFLFEKERILVRLEKDPEMLVSSGYDFDVAQVPLVDFENVEGLINVIEGSQKIARIVSRFNEDEINELEEMAIFLSLIKDERETYYPSSYRKGSIESLSRTELYPERLEKIRKDFVFFTDRDIAIRDLINDYKGARDLFSGALAREDLRNNDRVTFYIKFKNESVLEGVMLVCETLITKELILLTDVFVRPLVKK